MINLRLGKGAVNSQLTNENEAFILLLKMIIINK